MLEKFIFRITIDFAYVQQYRNKSKEVENSNFGVSFQPGSPARLTFPRIGVIFHSLIRSKVNLVNVAKLLLT